MGEGRGTRGRRVTTTLCAVCTLAAAVPAGAKTLDLDLGVEHTDNVGRTSTNEESETIGTARAAFVLATTRPRFTTDIAADLRYQKYLDNTFDDELVGGLNGSLDVALLPERFMWAFEDSFGQIANNRQAVETPDNRQNFNYFSTGPDIKIPFGDRTEMRLGGRWADADYEESAQNSETISGNLGLARKMSLTSTVSLNGAYSNIKYDEAVLVDEFEVNSAFARVEATGTRTTLAGDLGYTQARHTGQTSGGLLAHLQISRRVGTRSELSLNAGTDFQDTAGQFRLDQTAGRIQAGDQNAVAATDVFRSTFAYVGWNTRYDRSSFGISLNGIRERHEIEKTLDRDSIGAGFNVSRQFTQRVEGSVRGSWLDEEFVSGIAFQEWSAGVGLSFKLSRSMSLRITADHYSGSGDAGAREYEETRAFAGIRYSLGN